MGIVCVVTILFPNVLPVINILCGYCGPIAQFLIPGIVIRNDRIYWDNKAKDGAKGFVNIFVRSTLHWGVLLCDGYSG